MVNIPHSKRTRPEDNKPKSWQESLAEYYAFDDEQEDISSPSKMCRFVLLGLPTLLALIATVVWWILASNTIPIDELPM